MRSVQETSLSKIHALFQFSANFCVYIRSELALIFFSLREGWVWMTTRSRSEMLLLMQVHYSYGWTAVTRRTIAGWDAR